MGSFSIDKGKRGERELCGLLREYIGVEATRNLKQYQKAQHGDIEQLIGPYLIECKDQKVLNRKEWWRQAVAASLVRGDCLPCNAYRLPYLGLYDRWRFNVPDASIIEHEWQLDFRYTADLGLDAFAARVRESLERVAIKQVGE